MTRTLASRKRRGFTLVDLLVAVLLVGFSGGVLLASLNRVRSADDRAVSANNLKQMALATINCADSNDRKLPPGLGSFYPSNQIAPLTAYGPCLFHILPYLEQQNLYKSALVQVGGNSVYASWTGKGTPLKIYIAPGDPTAEPSDRTSYLANGLVLTQAGARYPASIPDGTSQTILYAEAYSRAVGTLAQGGKTSTWEVQRRWWDEPVWTPTLRAVPFQLAPPSNAASASLPQGFSRSGIQVIMADGSVRSVNCSAQTFFHACTPSGGEVLGSDW